MKNVCNSKIKILKKSEELFAKNGYSATPISKIADECNISKSLVSYHFKKKKIILKSIIDYHFSEISEKRDKIIKKAVNDYKKNGNRISENIISSEMINIMMKKENFWKLIVFEIIRNEDIWDYFKNFLKKWHEDVFEKLNEMGIVIKNKKRFIFNRIFNIVGPVMLYMLRREEWNKYFGLKESEVKDFLIKNFNKIKNENNFKEEK